MTDPAADGHDPSATPPDFRALFESARASTSSSTPA